MTAADVLALIDAAVAARDPAARAALADALMEAGREEAADHFWTADRESPWVKVRDDYYPLGFSVEDGTGYSIARLRDEALADAVLDAASRKNSPRTHPPAAPTSHAT